MIPPVFRSHDLQLIWMEASKDNSINDSTVKDLNIADICLQIINQTPSLDFRVSAILLGGLNRVNTRKCRLISAEIERLKEFYRQIFGEDLNHMLGDRQKEPIQILSLPTHQMNFDNMPEELYKKSFGTDDLHQANNNDISLLDQAFVTRDIHARNLDNFDRSNAVIDIDSPSPSTDQISNPVSPQQPTSLQQLIPPQQPQQMPPPLQNLLQVPHVNNPVLFDVDRTRINNEEMNAWVSSDCSDIKRTRRTKREAIRAFYPIDKKIDDAFNGLPLTRKYHPQNGEDHPNTQILKLNRKRKEPEMASSSSTDEMRKDAFDFLKSSGVAENLLPVQHVLQPGINDFGPQARENDPLVEDHQDGSMAGNEAFDSDYITDYSPVYEPEQVQRVDSPPVAQGMSSFLTGTVGLDKETGFLIDFLCEKLLASFATAEEAVELDHFFTQNGTKLPYRHVVKLFALILVLAHNNYIKLEQDYDEELQKKGTPTISRGPKM